MASNFSRKIKAKNGNAKELDNIIKELNDIPDNGVLDEVKAQHEPVEENDENSTSEKNLKEIFNDKTSDQTSKTEETTILDTNSNMLNESNNSLNKKNDREMSYKKAPLPLDKYEDDSEGTVYWSCRLDEEVIEKFELTVFMNDTSAKELINRLISAEKVFYDNHKGLITMDIIKANIKNKYIYDDSKVNKGFTLYPKCKEILKTYPRRYGMTMTAFIEYLINKYCDEY